MDFKEYIIEEQKRISKIFPSDVLESKRENAKTTFNNIGFPARKNEEWRFTNINPIVNGEFKFVVSDSKKSKVTKLPEYKLDGDIIVILNGVLSKELSKIQNSNDKVFVGSFTDAMNNNKDVIEKHFGKYANESVNGFTALNTSLLKEGVLVHFPKNTTREKPVTIINYFEEKQNGAFSNHRNLIVLEKNSKAEVNEIYYSETKSFSNVVTEIFIDENSELHYNKIQNEGDNAFHVGTTEIEQKNDSRFYGNTISWGGSVLRNNLNSNINGGGIDCYFRGLYLVKGKQIIDNHTLADHSMPNSHSNELYKGIIDESGNAIFNGKIMVRKDAQKTNAYQTNNNILLTNNANVNSKPQLEIFADDVKCSHGATTGQINPDEVFYLRARGIDELTAKKMLLSAYAHQIIDEISNEELRDILIEKLDSKLG